MWLTHDSQDMSLEIHLSFFKAHSTPCMAVAASCVKYRVEREKSGVFSDALYCNDFKCVCETPTVSPTVLDNDQGNPHLSIW